MGIISIKNLIHDYVDAESNKKFRAVDDISIDINAGDFIAVIGRNGSGKSSLAKHINVLLMPTEGSVWVDKMDTSDKKKTFDIRQVAGMVFQNPDDQIVATVVEEDVAFGPENLSIERNEIEKRVDHSLETVEMMDFKYRSPLKLSGGQKQRVAIAGIIAMGPKCIVLDEPTSMLDPSGRTEVLETIKKLNEAGVTIILITHNMDEAAQADKVFVMDEGKIALQGKPREVFEEVEQLKNFGLEIPAVTELAYEMGMKGILTVDELVEKVNEQNRN